MKEVKLNNGLLMPMVGLGTLGIKPEETPDVIATALNTGYKLIDTAPMYGNEAEVGQGLAKSGVSRDQIFITAKIDKGGYETAKKEIQQSLKNLQVDYFDLLLIHWPTGKDGDTYRAMEEAYKAGLTRAIGLSDFNAQKVDEIIASSDVKPAVDQIETHLRWQQNRMHAYLKKEGIVHEGWAPLGEDTPGFFDAPEVKQIAANHNKSAAQVMLRFLTQQGIVVIPKTTDPAQMKENLNVFDFRLTADEMKKLQAMDRRLSVDDNWVASMQEFMY